MRFALDRELVSVFMRRLNFPQQVFGKFVFENRVRKLFQQNWREIYIRLKRQALLLQFAKR